MTSHLQPIFRREVSYATILAGICRLVKHRDIDHQGEKDVLPSMSTSGTTTPGTVLAVWSPFGSAAFCSLPRTYRRWVMLSEFSDLDRDEV